MTAKESAAAPKKRLEISILLDYYGALLTERQREILDYYYNDDMSLSEIADETGITRQGVRDALKKGEALLSSTEEKLSLAARFEERSELIDKIVAGLTELEKSGAQVEELLLSAKELQSKD